MHSLDLLLSEHIQKSLEKNLGIKETKRIEGELYSWYEINLKQSMTLFDKIAQDTSQPLWEICRHSLGEKNL